jgi:hypothetical protein
MSTPNQHTIVDEYLEHVVGRGKLSGIFENTSLESFDEFVQTKIDDQELATERRRLLSMVNGLKERLDREIAAGTFRVLSILLAFTTHIHMFRNSFVH